jgi:nicotinamide-nucleotide amidase
MISCAILTIGSEILDGRVLDTNSQELALGLEENGGKIVLKLSCDDSIEAIADALLFLESQAQFVVVTGGLGPTSDDVTRYGIARYLGDEIVRSDEILELLAHKYAERGRSFLEINKVQADFPSSSTIVPNPVGSAPGFFCEKNKTFIYALPGVPKELRVMFHDSVIGGLQKLGAHSPQQYTFRVFGLPESVVAAQVTPITEGLPVKVSYRAHFPEIIIRLEAVSELSLLSEDSPLLEKVRGAIGKHFIFAEGITPPRLEDVVGRLFRSKKLTLATAESCTGGMLGKILTDAPGASDFYNGGCVTYSNKMKNVLLGVRDDSLASYGAVSGQVAREMAEGAYSHSSVGISITGIAGPDGGTPGKPVGTFFVCISTAKGSTSYEFCFSSSRDRIRRFSVYKALDLLRRTLLELPLPE